MQAAVLLGAPGSGKGTIAAAITRQSDFRHISTGYAIRQEMRNPESQIGIAARPYMEQSEYVPDDLAVKLVQKILKEDQDGQILFDGFPRTEAQGQQFDALLAEGVGALVGVFLLEADESVLIERLQGRRCCERCGAVFNRVWNPPVTAGMCDACGGGLIQRRDDFEENVVKRLKLHDEAARGLVQWYDDAGRLTRIDATQDPAISANQILAAVKK